LAIYLVVSGELSSQNLAGEGNSNLSKKKNYCEGGINIYRLDHPIYSYYLQYYDEYKKLENNFFRGINFKYYFGKNAFRCNFDYYKEVVHVSYDESFKEGVSKTGILNVGYQRLLRKARFSPYVFTDLSYAYSEENGMRAGYIYLFNYIGYQNRTYHLKTSSFGISPGLGLRYNPVKSIVLGVETNILYSFSFQRDVKGDKKTYESRRLIANPVQATLGFIF